MTRLNTISAICLLVFFLLITTTGFTQENKYYKKTLVDYNIPDVTLIDQEGHRVTLRDFLNSDKPVVMDFMYGTCTTICPVLSASFSHFQKGLGTETENVRMVSVTIDPDNDTPELMKQYLARYGGKPGWDILTGNRNEVVKVLREFDAYVANKMDHFPLTIMRAPGSREWVRLYGMLSASDLKKEFKELAVN